MFRILDDTGTSTGVTGNSPPPLKIFPPGGEDFLGNFPPGGEDFLGNFPPTLKIYPPRGVNFPMKAVLRVKTANLPPDRGYWHFLKKKKIGGYKFLGKLPPGGYKFLGKPPPPPSRGVNFPRIFFPPGGKFS